MTRDSCCGETAPVFVSHVGRKRKTLVNSDVPVILNRPETLLTRVKQQPDPASVAFLTDVARVREILNHLQLQRLLANARIVRRRKQLTITHQEPYGDEIIPPLQRDH